MAKKKRPPRPDYTHRVTIAEVFEDQTYRDENNQLVRSRVRVAGEPGKYMNCLCYVDEEGRVLDGGGKEIYPELRDERGKITRNRLEQWDDDTFRIGDDLAEKHGVSAVAL